MVLYGCVLWSFTLIHQTWKSCHIKSSLEASKTLPKNDAFFSVELQHPCQVAANTQETVPGTQTTRRKMCWHVFPIGGGEKPTKCMSCVWDFFWWIKNSGLRRVDQQQEPFSIEQLCFDKKKSSEHSRRCCSNPSKMPDAQWSKLQGILLPSYMEIVW